MHLFITDSTAARTSFSIKGQFIAGLAKSCANSPEYWAGKDGLPFFISDEGKYISTLNRWIRFLTTDGVSATSSIVLYAKDIHKFARFLLRTASRNLNEAAVQDVTRYKEYCLHESNGPRYAISTWNRTAVGLIRYYDWAEEEGLVEFNPTATRGLKVTPPTDTRVKSLTMAQYQWWRDNAYAREVNSTGRISRVFQRNRAIAELTCTTGLRANEVDGLTVLDLPLRLDAFGKNRSLPLRVPSVLAKGQKSRETIVSHRVIRDFVLPYWRDERSHWIERNRDQLLSDPSYIWATPGNRNDQIRIQTTRNNLKLVSLDRYSLEERQKTLLFADDSFNGETMQPLALWLNMSGRALGYSGLQTTCSDAATSEAAEHLPFFPTMHTLRHTFAVHMLGYLIRIKIGSINDYFTRLQTTDGGLNNLLEAESLKTQSAEPLRESMRIYDLAIGDPLDTVRRLLGHSSITTTFIYLNNIREQKDQIDLALKKWEEDFSTNNASFTETYEP